MKQRFFIAALAILTGIGVFIASQNVNENDEVSNITLENIEAIADNNERPTLDCEPNHPEDRCEVDAYLADGSSVVLVLPGHRKVKE
ncbi:MAG: hypothetical protein J6B13_06475 [Muribaculaceae bacterium]|nr:hypothetical protein [Muribaculaceae bacterium]